MLERFSKLSWVPQPGSAESAQTHSHHLQDSCSRLPHMNPQRIRISNKIAYPQAFSVALPHPSWSIFMCLAYIHMQCWCKYPRPHAIPPFDQIYHSLYWRDVPPQRTNQDGTKLVFLSCLSFFVGHSVVIQHMCTVCNDQIKVISTSIALNLS